MKPLVIVVAVFLLSTHALPENIDEVKELPQAKEPVVEAEESEPQVRTERCSACAGNLKLNVQSPNEVLAAIRALPGAEVHTQQSFEGCSSDKGCAGLKVKDGQVIERFGNLDAFRQAAAANTGGEFQFHAAGSNLGSVFEGGVPNGGPFWWMNQDSPFKNAGGSGGSYEKFSKSSSSSFSTTGGAAGANGVDISANPFLNGDFSKLSGGFASGAANGAANGGVVGDNKGFSSSSFESSSFSSSSNSDVDLSKNPFLNGGIKFGQTGFQGQAFGANQGAAGVNQAALGNAGASQGSSSFNRESSFSSTSFGANGGVPNQGNLGAANQGSFASQAAFGSNKFGTGYTGSSPRPFTASTAGSNINLIQNTQKASEFDFEQQQQTQQSIDEAFQSAGNVRVHEHSGGELQQTCAGQGYVCVHKAQCNNGVVNTNGQALLNAKTQKQYCNVKTEICCRIEVSTLAGAGNLQGSLGVGSATFSGSSNGAQGSGLFVSGQSESSNTAFGQSGSTNSAFGQSGSTNSAFGQSGSFANGNRGSSNQFGSNQFGAGTQTGFNANRGVSVESSSFDASRSSVNKFGANGFGPTVAPIAPTSQVFKSSSESNFIETDSFSAGSENTGFIRPGVTGLKPGIPYLPPVDSSNSGTNAISSTAFPTTFVTTPRPFSTPKPTYLPPPVSSTSAPGYLPPVGDSSNNRETILPSPNYIEGELILDTTRTTARPFVPQVPVVNEIPSGCAAALKCTPIEFCTAEGVISNTTVVLTRDQESYRVPLTDCKDLQSGIIGKCCRDPLYTDPWPTNQLGKWVPGVFGGNDGKYVPDNRGTSNNRQPVTARPETTGSLNLSPNRPQPTVPSFRPNQITPGFQQGSFQKQQFEQGQIGLVGQREQGQFGVGAIRKQQQAGQFGQDSIQQSTQQFIKNQFQGQNGQRKTGQGVLVNGGQIVTQEQGQIVSQEQGGFGVFGKGQVVKQGEGQFGSQAQLEIQNQANINRYNTGAKQFGQTVTQNQASVVQGVRPGVGIGVTQQQGQFGVQSQGQFGTQSQGQINRGQTVVNGQRQEVITGGGQIVTQEIGEGIRQGGGLFSQQGGGFGVERDYSESVHRVFLQRYNGNGQCGVKRGQKPFGNRNDLEVDFAEIPWQAMVLLQTNRSLLCGGVITRPDVVVTSASCVEGLNAKNVLIKGGEWKLGIDDEPLPFQIVQVKTILRHPFYKRGSLVNDAAILVLAENLRFANNIYPICLPDAKDTLDAFYNGAGECIVTGWGKLVLQAHLQGSIMHSVNVSLINPGDCQAKLNQDYPHLLEQYDQDSCACGQPTNPANNICKVDIGSALACTTGDGHYVFRGIYSWDSGCQLGNQIAAFYKFDVEWYEWAIGLIESVRFAKFGVGSQYNSQQFNQKFSGQIQTVKGSQFTSGVKGALTQGGVKGAFGQGQGAGQVVVSGQRQSQTQFGQGEGLLTGQGQATLTGQGLSQLSGQQGLLTGQGLSGQGISGQNQFSQFSKFSESSSSGASGLDFGSQLKAPITNSFSATYSEKKVFQSEPKIVSYTTKPEIVTFTTKPEYYTFTTKPKIVTYTTKPKIITYTTKPQIITYETSGSGTNPQYVAPGVTFNPSFADAVGQHTHNAQCKCNGKK